MSDPNQINQIMQAQQSGMQPYDPQQLQTKQFQLGLPGQQSGYTYRNVQRPMIPQFNFTPAPSSTNPITMPSLYPTDGNTLSPTGINWSALATNYGDFNG